MAKENDATGEDEGVAALKEDRKRGQRGERVFGSGGEDLEEGKRAIAKGAECFNGKRSKKKRGGGRGIEVAKCLVVF